MPLMTRKYFTRLHNRMMDDVNYCRGYAFIMRSRDQYQKPPVFTTETLVDLYDSFRNNSYCIGVIRALMDIARNWVRAS